MRSSGPINTKPVTEVRFFGDQSKAQSLAHAHLERFLLDFRRNVSFQDIPTYSETKKFYDRNGRRIGTIAIFTYKISGGDRRQEIVNITCEPERVMRQATIVRPNLVPCFRSGDNQWFVACLSGTFNGPYLAFENTLGIPADDFAYDKEAALDKKLLGTSGTASLYMVAQTGTNSDNIDYDTSESPDTSGAEPGTWKPWSSLTFDEQKPFLSNEDPLCCPDHGAAYMSADADYSPTYNWNGYATVDGSRMDIPPSTYSTSHNVSGTFNYFKTLFADVACTDMEELVQSFWDESPLPPIWLGTPPPHDTESDGATSGYDSTTTAVEKWVEPIDVSYESMSSFATVYAVTDRNTETTTQKDYGGCEETEQNLLVDTDDRTYSYFFRVGASTYTLRGPGDRYPEYQLANDYLKYYHTDSIADETGIFSSYMYYTVGTNNYFAYHHASTKSSAGLTVTTFPRVAGVSGRHIIPGVSGLPDGVEFFGEIFMGYIVYQ